MNTGGMDIQKERERRNKACWHANDERLRISSSLLPSDGKRTA
jgi:hypothetical protein